MKYLYGNSWEKYPIQDNETWADKKTGSSVTVCDITKSLPIHMLTADMIYSDPPWALGNANCFITKAGQDNYLNKFSEFSAPFFSRIAEISPAVCYVEIGKQNLQLFKDKLSGLFQVIQEWEIMYYKKHPCFLLRGGVSPQAYDFTALDDTKTPEIAIKAENPSCVADLCTGQGLTAVAAYHFGRQFVGTELNRRRLAVAIDRVNKLGGRYESSIS